MANPTCEAIDDGGPYNGIDWQATCETLQTKVTQLQAALAEARRDAERMAKWIVRHGPDFPGWIAKDHACAECVPDGDLVKPGFRCATHTAAALARVQEPPHAG